MAGEYRLKHYIWPLSLACLTTLGLYALTHPSLIQRGLWVGILEEVINVHGADTVLPGAIIGGRALFWGWLGAYIYSFHLTWRRFLAYDLTPSVYLFTANRSLLAMAISAIVGHRTGHFLYSGRRAL